MDRLLHRNRRGNGRCSRSGRATRNVNLKRTPCREVRQPWCARNLLVDLDVTGAGNATRVLSAI
jgi:hypothetical protein